MATMIIPLILSGKSSSQVSAETGCNHVTVPSDVEALFVAIHDDVHELIFKAFRIVKSHIALQVMH